MDEKTLTALKGSIAKWEAIVAGTGKDEGCDNCSLCQLFHPECGGRTEDIYDENACNGCPVKDKTGSPLCEGSPYDDYTDERTPAGAFKELEFLRSLLPMAETAVAVIADHRGTK